MSTVLGGKRWLASTRAADELGRARCSRGFSVLSNPSSLSTILLITRKIPTEWITQLNFSTINVCNILLLSKALPDFRHLAQSVAVLRTKCTVSNCSDWSTYIPENKMLCETPWHCFLSIIHGDEFRWILPNLSVVYRGRGTQRCGTECRVSDSVFVNNSHLAWSYVLQDKNVLMNGHRLVHSIKVRMNKG